MVSTCMRIRAFPCRHAPCIYLADPVAPGMSNSSLASLRSNQEMPSGFRWQGEATIRLQRKDFAQLGKPINKSYTIELLVAQDLTEA